jgi:hypothetical protein
MNAYFFPVSNEERENILNKHKHVYNGYKTLNPNPVENEQPLFVQDFANDKGGLVVNNKGEVKAYTNMGINEARKRKPYLDDDDATDIHPHGESDWNKPKEVEKGEVDEFFYFDVEDEETKEKKQKERQQDLDSMLSMLGDKIEKNDDSLDESEHMCEQCGLKESLCECGGYMEEAECNECWNEGEVDEAEDGGLSTIDELGDAIMGSGRLEEILQEINPDEFSDEFEFVDNVISNLISPYSDDEYYDELYDYIKDMYGEKLFDMSNSDMDDEDFDEVDVDFGDEDEYVTEQSNNILSSETDSPIGRSSYSYISGGPEQFSDDEDKEHDGYEDDIENIQNMFDYASQHDADPDSKDMIRNLNKDMNQEFDGDEPSDDEKEAYTFISGGPPGVTFREEEEELDEEEVEEKWSEKYKNSIDCNNPKGFSQKAHCQGKKKESKEEVEKEVDEDLRESFVTQRNKITEMFQRFNKYN